MAGLNQIQIPVIQTQDANLTVVQQNTNTVFRNIGVVLQDLTDFLSESLIVGEIKIANLTIEQFQSIAGTEWLLCNGQSCVNTTYSRLTGHNTVPNISLGSVNNFIKVN